jgi:putative transposase
LANAMDRDLFLRVLEEVRERHGFVVVGYVVMPEHIHLLLSEPAQGNPSVVMQSLKQVFAHRLLQKWRKQNASCAIESSHIWQRRFYDFVVFTEKKRTQKLGYMHLNPVKRGLVDEEHQWPWSSFRHYTLGERGPVLINEVQKAELVVRKIA